MPNSKDIIRGKVTVSVLQAKKARREPITMLTAYDYPTALIMDNAGIDSLLVGDSLGMVVLGYENTLPVTMEDMLHHCKAVSRGASKAHLIGDMPFMSYQVSAAEAVRNAGRFLQEGGMDAVKLEGGRERAAAIKAIVSAGIPVMGHLGLTPQSVHKLGGWKIQGKSADAALRLVEDAHLLENAGCYALVLEAIPDRLAELISRRLQIPVIGIGAGAGCDGQVLVAHDMLGMFQRFTPIFVKKYADLNAQITEAVRGYISDVNTRSFPAAENSHPMDESAYQELLKHLGSDSGKLQVAG
ncbi:MAG: panB [Acidobacteria bacterium]|jgi:3-methyl-2-oxobutanoate hydroxymethyltransferase|nr:panB [Acidobacteriota bacterium]